MTENEIQENIKRQIQIDLNVYLSEPFESIIYPEWFYKGFKDTYMNMNQAQVPHRYETIVSIINKIRAKNVENLSMFEAGLMTSLWMAVNPVVVDKDIDKFLIKRGWLESVMAKYEELKQVKLDSLFKKATTTYNNTRQTSKRLITV